MATKYIIPALAAASGAYAQCSAASATTTLTAASDATAIAGCPTYTGSIAIATGVAGTVVLDGIQRITGSLVGPSLFNLTGISASTLTTVGRTFSLAGAPSINTFNVPMLNSVTSLQFVSLGPGVQNLGFSDFSQAQDFTLQDTYIQNLDGVSLTSAATISIVQNQYLVSISQPLTTVTDTLSISDNNNNMAQVSLPVLATAGIIDISGVSALSLPLLKNTTGAFYARTTTLENLALPNLTQSAGLTINDNPMLTNFTVPAYVRSTASVNVENNTALTGTISFPALTSVTGSVIVDNGAFSSLLIPELNTVQGSMNISSSGDITSTCSHFEAYQGNIVHGSVDCDTGSTTSPSASGTGTSASPTVSATGAATSTGAASTTYGPAQISTFTAFGLLAAFFGLLM